MALPSVGKQEQTHYTDSFFRRFRSFFENPDKTLTENASSHGWQGIEAYKEMLRLDGKLTSLQRKRAGAVASLEYKIKPGGPDQKHSDQAEFTQAIFDELESRANFSTTRATQLTAVSFGYRPSEIIYGMRNGLVVIEAIKTRDPARFRFDENDQMVFVGENQAERLVLEPWKFMANTWGSDESPYGHGMLRELYPLWYFKSMGLKDFTRYLEKMGSGWTIGTYPAGTSTEQIDKFAEMLQEMQSNNTGAVPEGTEIDIKQGAHQGVKDIFSWIIDYADHQFTLAYLEQTTSTESESGTFALGRFQSLGEQRVIEAVAKWQEAQYNKVIRFLIDINFGEMPPGQYPTFSYDYEVAKDQKVTAEAIGAVLDIGVTVTLRQALKELGRPIPPGVSDEELDQPLEKLQPTPLGGGFTEFDDDPANGLASTADWAMLADPQKKKLFLGPGSG